MYARQVPVEAQAVSLAYSFPTPDSRNKVKQLRRFEPQGSLNRVEKANTLIELDTHRGAPNQSQKTS